VRGAIVFLLLALAAEARAAETWRVAVVVGNNEGSGARAPLR
jgi:hypothetical protein